MNEKPHTDRTPLRSLVTVGTGKGVHAAAGFLAGVLIARNLGPSGFGLYSLAVAVTILVQETCGYGLETALVRSASPLWATRESEAWSLCSAFLLFKTVIAGGFLVAGLPLAWLVGTLLLPHPRAALAVAVGLAGALTTALWRGSSAILQSKQRFRSYAAVQGTSNLLKLAGVALMAGLGALHLNAALGLHVLCPLLVFAVAVVPIAARLFRARRGARDAAGRLFHYGRWVILSSLLFATHYRADVLMLSALTGPTITGLYNAAFVLASVVDHLTISLDAVLLPRFSRLAPEMPLQKRVRRIVWLTVPVMVALVPVALLARPIITALFGAAFASSAPVLQLLIPGVGATLLVQPFLVAVYARGSVRALVPLDAAVLALNLAANILLIPRYGAVGAAIATSSARIVRALLVLRLASRTLAER